MERGNPAAPRWRAPSAVAIIVLAVAAHTLVNAWPAVRSGNAIAGTDTYTYFYPGIRYAVRALAAGQGLLWNPLQNCGEPAFANPQFNFVYPFFLILGLTGVEAGVALLAALHLVIAGLGMLWLCRVLGLGWVAALSGAAAFGVSGIVLVMLLWQPTVFAPYLLLPLVLAVVERIMHAPHWRWGALLGVVLTLQILAGYPQITAFTYQLVLLRMLWHAVTVRRAALPALVTVGVGLLLAPLLGAFKLWPGIAFARESIRAGGLSKADLLTPFFNSSLTDLRNSLASPVNVAPFRPAVLCLMLLGLLSPVLRRRAAFYWLATGLFLSLAFDNPLYDLYLHFPLAMHFRAPVRFLWMVNVTACVLAAYGVQALADLGPGNLRRHGAVVALPVAAGLAMWGLAPRGSNAIDLGVAAVVFAVAGLSSLTVRARSVLLAAIPLAFYALVWLVTALLQAGAPAGAAAPTEPRNGLERYAANFGALRQRMTAQQRIYQFSPAIHWSLTPKTGMLFDIPSAVDREPETSRRYADLMMALRSGARRPYSFVQWELAPPTPHNRPLLNLVAARYLLTDGTDPLLPDPAAEPLRQLGSDGALRTYENTTALPRAFFVPRAEVEPDSGRVLARLMTAEHDPRRVALIETPPPDGFLGSEPGDDGAASVRFLDNGAERVRLQVDAPQQGFLFLADQAYPDWRASVNDEPAPILRANYAFRLVRVPAGRSVVLFEYRPPIVVLGALVSLLSAVLLAIALAVDTWRRASRG